MIKAGVAPLDATDALCRAAGMSVTVVELLAKCGVNIAALRTNDGGTACHIAAKRGDDVDVFEHLINVAKVNIFAKDLVSGFTCTFLCAKLGRHKALRFLIDAGANLDATDDHGASALVAASTATNVDCVTLLLAAGVNVDAKDRIGRTACHFLLAGMTANRAVPARKTLVALLAAGADLDTLDDSGMTPRHFAVRVGALAVPPNDDEINAARHLIVTTSLELVRKRALQVCIGLHALELDALQMCEILIHACGRAAQVIPFHLWWRIATTVKHFH